MHQQQLLFAGNEAIFAKINIKQMEKIEFSLHPICVVGEIKSGRAPIKSEHKNLEHSQTSHKQVKIHRK